MTISRLAATARVFALVALSAAGLAVKPAMGQEGIGDRGAFLPPVASYTLTAELDPETHRIHGEGTLTWRNPSREPTSELYFHLYLNAFRNTASTFLRTAETTLRDEKIETLENGWGWIEIERLSLDDRPGTALSGSPEGTSLLGGLECVAPDDGNAEDCTLARVSLPLPVAPGDEAVFHLEFTSRLPRVVDRTGFKGDFHLVAQWFPKMARLEPGGTWHTHQFHPYSEFYADYGTYDVTLVVPERFVVGATGNLLEDRTDTTRSGWRRMRFLQAGVHDFAWTAWPGFVRQESTFSHPGLPDVQMVLLLRPETERVAERYFAALRHGLQLFGTWYGPYPYRTLTMVDPPWGAENAGAMEYPTFITTGTRVLNPPATHDPEWLTVHELGHQFWYGLVATDEFREAFLDEGINSYSTARVMREAYGPLAWSYRLWGWNRVFPNVRLDYPRDAEAGYFRAPSSDPIARTAWGFLDDDAYWNLNYDKMALVFEQLERTLGSATMERGMRAYATRYRFRHPRTRDLIRTLSEESGRDLTPWFEQTLYGSEVLDYAVTEVETAPRTAPIGVFGEGEERQVSQRVEELPGWDSTVVVRRLGGLRLPVTVELVFEGERVRRTWEGEERWIRYRIEGPRLLWVEVDPDEVHVLDVNRLNNSLRVEPDRRASRSWTERVGFWIQNLLEIFAGFS